MVGLQRLRNRERFYAEFCREVRLGRCAPGNGNIACCVGVFRNKEAVQGFGIDPLADPLLLEQGAGFLPIPLRPAGIGGEYQRSFQARLFDLQLQRTLQRGLCLILHRLIVM